MQQTKRVIVVLDVRPMLRGSEKAVVEAVLGRRPGVERIEANPVSQTATVTYDATKTSLADLRRWVEECGLDSDGQSVPEHICDPLMEPDPSHGYGHHHAAAVDTKVPAAEGDRHHSYPAAPPAEADRHQQDTAAPAAGGHAGHGGHAAPAGHAPPGEEATRSPHEMMGHGGHPGHGGMVATAPCRWRPWWPTCATGSWSRPCSRSRSCCGPDRPGGPRLSGARPVRAAR